MSLTELNKYLDALWHRTDRRRRIRLHTTGDFMSEREFRAEMHLTPQQLALAEQRHEVFSLSLGKARYYPRVLTEGGRLPHRLRRLVRALGPTPPWLALNWLESRWTNLQGRTPLQAIRRSDHFFDALCDAEGQCALYTRHDSAELRATVPPEVETGDDRFGYEVHIPQSK